MNRRCVGEREPRDQHECGLHGELEDFEEATAPVIENFSRARSLKNPENEDQKCEEEEEDEGVRQVAFGDVREKPSDRPHNSPFKRYPSVRAAYPSLTLQVHYYVFPSASTLQVFTRRHPGTTRVHVELKIVPRTNRKAHR